MQGRDGVGGDSDHKYVDYVGVYLYASDEPDYTAADDGKEGVNSSLFCLMIRLLGWGDIMVWC